MIKRLQVGLTTICKIKKACKFCNKNLLRREGHEVNFSLQKESIINVFRKNNIDMIQICGNAGEALNHPDFDQILEVAREESNIGIEFNTNAAHKSKEWWENLPKILDRKEDIVMFPIDGINEVHEIHRSWSFDIVIQNMLSFIKGGGNAGWQFIVFKHNEHQLNLCKSLAKSFGCKKFVVRNSRKYDEELQAPTTMNYNNDRTTLFSTDYERKIGCWAKQPHNLLFISATSHFWPCPAIAGVYMLKPVFDTYYKSNPQKPSNKMIELIEKEMNGIININVEQNLEKIQRESELWSYVLSHTEKESICNCYCNENRNLFGDMNKNFHRIIELN